jgi:4-oxalocrotonate tautomerase family enzyme
VPRPAIPPVPVPAEDEDLPGLRQRDHAHYVLVGNPGLDRYCGRMAQVVVYGRRQSLDQRRNVLSEAIHAAIMSALDYPPEKKFQRFMPLDESDFIYPADRGADYTIIEISLFEGRTDAAKRALIAELFTRVEAQAGISPHSLEITITETPKVNWGIRGQNAADLTLNYRVEV